jgi:hypothetical protein
MAPDHIQSDDLNWGDQKRGWGIENVIGALPHPRAYGERKPMHQANTAFKRSAKDTSR